MADVQGFLTTITLDANVITAYCNDVSITRDKNVMDKATMNGTGIPTQLAGSKTGSVSISGQVDHDGQELLEATFAADTKVAIVIDVGDGASLKAGTYSGNVTLVSLPVEASAADTWNFSLEANGWLDYTAPV